MKTFLRLTFLLLLCGGIGLAQRPSIAPDAEQITPLLPGQIVPDVNFKTLDGEDYNLRAEVAKQQMVLIFYRGGW